MQLQVKPKLYADVNKQMDQSYYNYEDYDIEYGYISDKLVTSIITKSSTKLARANIQKCIQASILILIRTLLSKF